MKNIRTIYLISTGLLTALMLFSAGMYLFNNSLAVQNFEALNFPTWIIYPLAFAKILGLVALWTNKSETLKQWAFAGFFYNFLLALGAHTYVGDGNYAAAVLALIFLSVSFYTWNKLTKAS
ncbi:MAG: DoxX family protein [Bacteroidia bacterium]